eukprot:TRINITY_DN1428_c0_g1_i3.p1 TRINITY_DN1428_c0_g1~~TRINITY_DN1428_c0_g1_i3.p1  ORF type:complete len:838 (+),score=242.38 TRINITY_DN1428_c0_g1_i3:102-2615(+)
MSFKGGRGSGAAGAPPEEAASSGKSAVRRQDSGLQNKPRRKAEKPKMEITKLPLDKVVLRPSVDAVPAEKTIVSPRDGGRADVSASARVDKAIVAPVMVGRGGARPRPAGAGGRGRGSAAHGTAATSESSGDGDDASGDEAAAAQRKGVGERRARPNWFLAMRLGDEALREEAKVVQQKIRQAGGEGLKGELLERACVPIEKMHITLHVFNVPDIARADDERLAGINAAVADAVAGLRREAGLGERLGALQTRLEGVSHFKGDTAFANIHFSDRDAFQRLWVALGKALQGVGVELADDDFEKAAPNYMPHATLLKMSRLRGGDRKAARKAGLKAKIEASVLAPYKDHVFGTQSLASVELLSMHLSTAADGYYYCHSYVPLAPVGTEDPASPTAHVPRMKSVTATLTPASPERAAEPGSPMAGVPRMASVTTQVTPASPEGGPASPEGDAASPKAGVPRMASVTTQVTPASPEGGPASPEGDAASPKAGVPRMASVTMQVTPVSPEGGPASPKPEVPRMQAVTAQVAVPVARAAAEGDPASPSAGIPRMRSVTAEVAPLSPEPARSIDTEDPASPTAHVPRMKSVTATLTPASPERAAEPGSPMAGVPRMASVTTQVTPASPEGGPASPEGDAASPKAGVPRMASVTTQMTPASPEGKPAVPTVMHLNPKDVTGADFERLLGPVVKSPRASPKVGELLKSPQSALASKTQGSALLSAMSLGVENDAYRPRVVAMLKKHAPEKIGTVDTLCTAYAGREAQLIKDLVAKYGPEPKKLGRARTVSFKEELVDSEVIVERTAPKRQGSAKQSKDTGPKCDTMSALVAFGGLASLLAFKLMKK